MNGPPLIKTPLFASVPQGELIELLKTLPNYVYPSSMVLFYGGDPGDCFYIVCEGELEVIKAYGTQDERLLNTRGPGEHIGEMSFLIPDGLRTATVRTRTPTRLILMNREVFESLLLRWPVIAYDMARYLSQRLHESEKATIADLREKNRQLSMVLQELRQAVDEMVVKEKLLQESENRFRLLVELAPFGITLSNAAHQIEYVNPRFNQIFGYSLDDVPDIRSWHELAFPDPDYRENCVSLWNRDLLSGEKAGRVRDRTVTVRCRDGSKKITHIRSVLIGNGRILMTYEDITDRKIAEDALRDSEKQLRHMSSQLLSAQEIERKRIAGELHDSVGQHLTAIKFGVETSLRLMAKGKETAVAERLEMLLPIVQNTLKEVRRISKDLRPSLLDDLGILPTIDWFCREFNAIYTDITVEREIDVREDEIPVPLKIIVFRIIQEALNNVAKHSGARFVRISLLSIENQIRLQVQDDGRGIDFERDLAGKGCEVGLGLASMKERTELSGGSFVVKSFPRGGTTICAMWPGKK